jgi:hypothetical protein
LVDTGVIVPIEADAPEVGKWKAFYANGLLAYFADLSLFIGIKQFLDVAASACVKLYLQRCIIGYATAMIYFSPGG